MSDGTVGKAIQGQGNAIEGQENDELASIRADLEAIRGCLIRSGIADTQELAGRLRAVVEKFRSWTSVGLVDKESVSEIQRDLGELQPLFENAYTLHSGWFGLLDLQESAVGGQYDAQGQRSPIVSGAAETSGHCVYQQG